MFHFKEEISGQRLSLKKHPLSLAETMFQIVDQDRHHLSQFLPWVGNTNSVSDSHTFIKITHRLWERKEAFEYGIYLQNSDTFIGNIGAINVSIDHKTSEIGYWLNSNQNGNGYMSEAVSLLEKHLFEIGFFRIEIRCEPNNVKSEAVAKRCNYQFEGKLRSNCIINHKRRDTLIYSKLQSDQSTNL